MNNLNASTIDLISTSSISSEDLQRAKEEREQALQIAEDAIQVNKAFQAVGALVGEQHAAIVQMKQKTDAIKLEIGQGVSELEQAQRLQQEALRKKCLIALVVILLTAAITVPIVLTLLK
jgi:hypothetical protein